jgi:hypothetical protein
MIGARIDAQIAELLTAERAARQHPFDGLFHDPALPVSLRQRHAERQRDCQLAIHVASSCHVQLNRRTLAGCHLGVELRARTIE